MKTLLFIGILIAVISACASIRCYGNVKGYQLCLERGKKRVDTRGCDIQDCANMELPGMTPVCMRSTIVKDGKVQITLLSGCVYEKMGNLEIGKIGCEKNSLAMQEEKKRKASEEKERLEKFINANNGKFTKEDLAEHFKGGRKRHLNKRNLENTYDEICLCDTDLCNGAPVGTSFTYLTLAFMAGAVLFH